MSHDMRVVDTQHEVGQGSLLSYSSGFVLSIILTLAAYQLVVNHLVAGWALIFTILGLAVVQLLVQLLFFLHLGRESKPRWNLVVFLFMVLVVVIIAGGSLWIMKNLNYRTMSPAQTKTYLRDHEGL
ncbi:MAG: cytochrome o ubiquinol oxidase subunit IV [Candidatus Saccharibacteria bacterium]